MMTPLACGRCNEPWLDDAHRCPPTPAETELALEQAVVEAAIEWASAMPREAPWNGRKLASTSDVLFDAVSALQARRVGR